MSVAIYMVVIVTMEFKGAVWLLANYFLTGRTEPSAVHLREWSSLVCIYIIMII